MGPASEPCSRITAHCASKAAMMAEAARFELSASSIHRAKCASEIHTHCPAHSRAHMDAQERMSQIELIPSMRVEEVTSVIDDCMTLRPIAGQSARITVIKLFYLLEA